VRTHPFLDVDTSSNPCDCSRTLPSFLRDTIADGSLMQRNRRNVLSLLRSFSEEQVTHLQETCILAWAQVGRYICTILGILCKSANHLRIVKNDELNIVLLKLVGYLGHSNPIVSGVAFNEVGATA
jgi:serine/threonine-protein kinase ATR